MWKHFAEDGDMDKKLKQNIFFQILGFFVKIIVFLKRKKWKKWKDIFGVPLMEKYFWNRKSYEEKK